MTKDEFDHISLIGTFGKTKAAQLLALLAKEQECISKVGKIVSEVRRFIDVVYKSNLPREFKKNILKDYRLKKISKIVYLKADDKLKSVLENVIRTEFKLRTDLFK